MSPEAFALLSAALLTGESLRQYAGFVFEPTITQVTVVRITDDSFLAHYEDQFLWFTCNPAKQDRMEGIDTYIIGGQMFKSNKVARDAEEQDAER